MSLRKIYATLSLEEYKSLCSFDYGKLYSIHTGCSYTWFGSDLEIFCGVNKHGKLFINVIFHSSGIRRGFDFDSLDVAIKYAKNHVDVKEDSDATD